MVTVHWLFWYLGRYSAIHVPKNFLILWPADSHYSTYIPIKCNDNYEMPIKSSPGVISFDTKLSSSNWLTQSWGLWGLYLLLWKWNDLREFARVALFPYWFSNRICAYSMLQQSAVVFYCHWSKQSAGNFILWYSVGTLRSCFVYSCSDQTSPQG